MKAQLQGRRWQGWHWKASMLFVIVLCALRGLPADATGKTNQKYFFDIAPGEAAWRLIDFGNQSGLQLVFNFEDMKGVRVAAVHGEYEPLEALERMIAGTDIRYEVMNRRTVAFTRAPPAMRSAKALRDKFGVSRHQTADRRSSDAGLEEVTVSGTHPSSLAAPGSPDFVVSRAEIDAAGFVTTQGVIRTLPQIFGGGPTEDTILGYEARTNPARGTGVNLRGLGATSTLVLMNGRRLPGGGNEGLFTDVSNIPVIAIERIEILPDSSSTFHGSDAVGGVVNFVMRDDFEGRQTEAYLGESTRGGSFNENYISQLVGMHTASGHGLIAVDFYSRGNLPSAEREMAHSDLTEFGVSSLGLLQSNPGNVLLGRTIWAIPRNQDGTALKPGDFIEGTPNLQDQYKGADILLAQQRWTAFGTWRQKFNDTLSFFGDVLIGERDVRGRGAGAQGSFQVPVDNAFYASPVASPSPAPISMRYNFYDDLGPQVADARVRSADVTGGFDVQLGDRWQMTTTFGYASEHLSSLVQNQVDYLALSRALARSDPQTAFNPFGDGSNTDPAILEEIRGFTRGGDRSSVTSGGVFMRGAIATLPSGDIELSFGGDFREQKFLSTLLTDTTPVPTDTRTDSQRHIHSEFAGLQVPLIGPSNRAPGVEALILSFAERHEHYSDFGGSRATRLGLSWAPVRGVTVRGSYSDSFRPPGLLDLDESGNSYAYTQLRDPTTGEPETVLLWGGKSRDLKEETAHSWTAGLEFESTQDPGAALALTYFSTNFTDRLNTPGFSTDLLSNPALSPLVIRNPSDELRADVCSRAPIAAGVASCLTTQIGAIIDLRYRNDAIVHTQGFDVLGRYEILTKLGRFSFALNGTYITNFAEARAAYQPLTNNVSTENHPINLKARAAARFQRGGLEISGYMNYLNHYEDTASEPQRAVASWTTFDLRAAYTLGSHPWSWLGDTTFALGAENLFDRNPPFLNNSAANIGYDQENADLTGRMVSFTVRKHW